MQDWSQFFDPSKAKGPTDAPDAGRRNPAGAGPRCQGPACDSGGGEPGGGALTVSALVARLKGAIGEAFPGLLTVVGELSNVKRHSSGHVYLSLKDAGSSIDAVIWRSRASKLPFEPTDGLDVVVEGRLDVYERRGSVQLYVERMTPKGEGALELAFRQLREKLQREGLFDPARKKPLPRLPRAIGIVTSPTGAAIRDIRRTLLRRWPGARAYLVAARVQGETAAGEVAEALRLLDQAAGRYEIDVLIVARGGGSLEDLWAFNEEPVARAVFEAHTPVVSGVGHEVDVTICDLVADVRAATPTAAAERVVPDAGDLSAGLDGLMGRLRRRLIERVDAARRELRGVLRSVAFRDPMWRVRGEAQHVPAGALRQRA
jgi:exodeoxyribonuclease VII large subunit